MPDEIKPMIKIGNVTPPQFLNEQGDWELVRGSGGSYRMQSSVEVADEPFSGSGNLTKEFTSEMTGIEISNDSVPGATGAADLTFTINGKTRMVKAGEVVTGRYKPFTVVTINSTVAWRAEGLQTIGGFAVSPPVDTTAPDNVTNLQTSALTATSLTLTWVASASNDCIGYDVYRGSTLIGSVTGTTYNATGLTQATQYTFTVKAKDAANNISSGTSTTVTTSSNADTTPPANVTNLTTANITQTGLTLNWTPSISSDASSYDIYNGTTFLANVTATTYNVNGLAASTAYTFWVKAKDASGNAATGTSVEATTSSPAVDTTAPSNVTNLTPSALTQTGVTLNWTAATDNVAVTGYEIYNGASLVTTVTGTTYNVTGLTASTQYTFMVKAKDAAGNVASGTSTTFTTSAPADTTPPIITANPTSGTYTSVQNVTLSSNESNTTIFYTTNGDAPTTDSAQYSSAIAVNASMTIKAIGRDQAGNVSSVQTFAYTLNLSDTTPPNPVTGLSAGTPTQSSVPLSWTLSSSVDVAAYEAAYSTDGTNFTMASAVINPASNTYTVTGLTAETAYTFRVVAIDATNNRSTAVTTTATTSATSGKVTSGLVNEWSNLTSQTTLTNDGTYFPASSDFTVYAMIKPKAFMNIISQYDIGKGTESMFRLYLDSTGKRANLNLWGTDNLAAGYFPGISSSTDILMDTAIYYHIAIVRNATSAKIYVNNALYGSVTWLNPPFTLRTNINTIPIKVGEATSDVKHVMYYNRELTTAELTQNFNNVT